MNSAGCTKRHSPALVQAAQAEWAARRLERECCSHRHTRLDVQGEQEIYPWYLVTPSAHCLCRDVHTEVKHREACTTDQEGSII